MTFMVLRTTIFKMKDIWRLHTKKDMYKRLASVHLKVGRGSLIPHLHSVRSEFATLKQTYCEFSMAKSIDLCERISDPKELMKNILPAYLFSVALV